MSLKTRIEEDLKNALKEKDSEKVSVLRLLLGAAKNKELEKRTQLSKAGVLEKDLEIQSILTDEEFQDVILSEIKKRRDSIESFKSGNRDDLAAKETRELEILTPYGPKQLDEGELRKVIKEKINELNIKEAKEASRLIGLIMSEYKNRVQGDQVKKMISEEFSNGG